MRVWHPMRAYSTQKSIEFKCQLVFYVWFNYIDAGVDKMDVNTTLVLRDIVGNFVSKNQTKSHPDQVVTQSHLRYQLNVTTLMRAMNMGEVPWLGTLPKGSF